MPAPVAEEDPEFQISTMVDVLMTLLLFFIATATTEIMEQTADLELPVAENALDPKESDKSSQLTINVARITGVITLGGNDAIKYEKPEQILPAVLEKKKSKEALSGKPLRILIRADKETKYSKIKEVMKVCAAAGVVDVIFAASPEKKPATE